MVMRIFVALIVIAAIGVGVCAIALPRDQLIKLIVFRDFFDITLPILAFGALVKYLCTCCIGISTKKCGCGTGCKCNCCKVP